MFDYVRGTLRKCHIRAQMECLESRCLLALAPASGEELPVTDWLRAIKSGDVAMVAAGSFKFHVPEIELGDLPSIPIPLPGGWPPSNFPEAPPWTPLLPPSGDWQGPSEPGGMIDIDDLENTSPDTFVDPASKREEMAVIEMLASLNYRPGRGASEFNFQAKDAAADEAFEATANRDATSGQPFHEIDSEGGMMAIAADAVISKFVEDEIPPEIQIESLTDISVHMENAYGKYQVFEVSTTEETRVREASPVPNATMVRPAQMSATEMIDFSESEPAANDRWLGGSVDGPLHVDEEPITEDVSPTDVEIAPPAAAPPAVGDETSTRSWTSGVALLAAAVGAFALRVHLTKRDRAQIAGQLRGPWPVPAPRR